MPSDSKPAAPNAPHANAKMERLVKLTLLLRERQPLSFADIRAALPLEYPPYEGDDARQRAKHHETLRRKFERDKQDLRTCGIVLVQDEQYRYALDEQASFAAPVQLSSEEESLLRCLCVAVLNDANYPFKTELRVVLAKIGDELSMPDMLPAHMQAGGEAAKGMEKIGRALYERKRLSFTYTDAKGASTQREVEPFGFFLYDKASYLVAYDPARGANRTFRVQRMGKLKVREGTGFAPRPFDVEEFSGLPFQFGGQLQPAQVRFAPERAELAQQLGTRHETTIAQAPDGSWLWNVQAARPRRLASWCVQQGPGVVPVAPPQAAAAYREGVRAALAAARGEAVAGE